LGHIRWRVRPRSCCSVRRRNRRAGRSNRRGRTSDKATASTKPAGARTRVGRRSESIVRLHSRTGGGNRRRLTADTVGSHGLWQRYSGQRRRRIRSRGEPSRQRGAIRVLAWFLAGLVFGRIVNEFPQLEFRLLAIGLHRITAIFARDPDNPGTAGGCTRRLRVIHWPWLRQEIIEQLCGGRRRGAHPRCWPCSRKYRRSRCRGTEAGKPASTSPSGGTAEPERRLIAVIGRVAADERAGGITRVACVSKRRSLHTGPGKSSGNVRSGYRRRSAIQSCHWRGVWIGNCGIG